MSDLQYLLLACSGFILLLIVLRLAQIKIVLVVKHAEKTRYWKNLARKRAQAERGKRY
jgi:hypothetical protein